MYRVVNQLTWQEFSVKTKDELYQELELLNARKNALDNRDEYQVSSVSEDGEIVDERTISIPFPDDQTVDELLFSFDEKKGKSLFSNLVSLIRKPQAKPVQEESVSQAEVVVPEEQASTPEESLERVVSHGEEMDETLTKTIQEEVGDSLVAHVAPKEPASVGNDYQTEEEEMPAPIPPKTLVPKASHRQPEAPQPLVSPTETFRAKEFEVDVRETSQILKQSFLTTIDYEVEEIDGLIERLRRERENRLRMRQALIDTTLL